LLVILWECSLLFFLWFFLVHLHHSFCCGLSLHLLLFLFVFFLLLRQFGTSHHSSHEIIWIDSLLFDNLLFRLRFWLFNFIFTLLNNDIFQVLFGCWLSCFLFFSKVLFSLFGFLLLCLFIICSWSL